MDLIPDSPQGVQQVEAVIITREERRAKQKASDSGMGVILLLAAVVAFLLTFNIIGPY